MQFLKKLFIISAISLMTAVFLMKYISNGASEMTAQVKAQGSSAQTAVTSPAIRPTYRISIPYGFQANLPVMNVGQQTIRASGHGGCTAGEHVTVAITVTQAISGAIATGENEHTCTGELQMWTSVITADTPTPFVAGAAQACGFATSYDGIYVSDTFDWCRDVSLFIVSDQIYIPLLMNQHMPAP